MPSSIEYALMAGNAYLTTRERDNIIPFPVSLGWSKADTPYDHTTNSANGFEATAYRKGMEIVISFAGTYSGSVFPGSWRDLVTDGELAIGDPNFTPFIHDGQLYDAAKYYEQIKQLYPPDQGYSISFTGHSLGGGLAALMGVFFNKAAVTFDQAPFREAATEANRDLLIEFLADQFPPDSDLAGFHSTLVGPVVQNIRGEANVSTIVVAGEFLTEGHSGLGYPSNALRIGDVPAVLEHGWLNPNSADRVDNLHSITLLEVLQYDHDRDGSLQRASREIPNLLPTFFDSAMSFVGDPDNAGRNLLEHLVRHQFGATRPDIPADGMLDGFIDELGQLVRGGAAQSLNEGLALVLMQGYWKIEGAYDASKAIFKPVSGGFYFNVSDVADSTSSLDAYSDLLKEVRDLYGAGVPGLPFNLAGRDRFYVESGEAALEVTGADNLNEALLGGALGDVLAGGGGDDLLLGANGDDALTGGSGNDILAGGAGTDIYRFTSGDGQDRILDSDGAGEIWLDGALLGGGKKIDGQRWQSDDDRIIYTLVDAGPDQQNLIITTSSGDDRITVMNFQSGQLGITLSDELRPDAPPTFDTVTLGDADSNYIAGTDANDRIEGLGGDDRLESFGKGRDLVLGGDGDDRIWNDNDRDTGGDNLQGNTGSDIVLGGGAADRVFGGDEISVSAALALDETQLATGLRGDWVDGQAGDDTVIGGAGNDALWGGGGGDVIVGGAGDDTIGGDLGTGYVLQDWAAQRSVTLQDPAIADYALSFQDASVAESAGAGGDDLIWAGAGDDWVFAGAGDDFVDGGSGSDVLFGSAGADQLLGGAGADVISGDDRTSAGDLHGDDTIFGGDGDDRLFGDGGSDYILGGDGADTLVGDDANLAASWQGSDYLDGGAGNDNISGAGGDDILVGGAGNDLLFGNAGDDSVYGDDGDDELQGNDGRDLLAGGLGADRLFGGLDGDFLYGDSGNDTLFGEDGDDSLDGGDGDDQLGGGAGFDSLSGGTGADRLYGEADDDFLDGGDGDDQMSGGDGNDSLYGSNGNDTLLGDAGSDSLYGEAGADQLSGGEGDDFVSGGDDADLVLGDAGSDLLLGDGGDDELQGGDGDDTVFAGLGSDRVFGGQGNDALFGGEDGDRLYGDTGNDLLFGGIGDDFLYGDDGADHLKGEVGSDELSGGAGDDTYLYALGDGADSIFESADSQGDRIVFGAGIDAADMRLAQRGSSLVFVPGADLSDQLAVTNWYSDPSLRVGSVEFDDGTTWNSTYLAQAANNVQLFLGDAGHNTIFGGFGDDTLYGFAGDDVLNGGPGNNVLIGGEGQDTFIAGPGSTTIVLNPGDGDDVIENAGLGHTVITFGTGVTASDLSYERIGDDLAIAWDEVAAVKGWFTGNTLSLEFADGSAAPATSQISEAAQNVSRQYTIARGSGTTTLEDWGGYDLVTFGAGIQPADIASARQGIDLVLTIANPAGPADRVVVTAWFDGAERQIEEFRFVDSAVVISGTALTTPLLNPTGTGGSDVLMSGAGYVETLRGLAGNDSLTARGGGDTLIGGTGNDRLYGTDGQETYVFSQGDGQDVIEASRGFDTIVVDRPWSAITVARAGNDDVITFAGSTDRITVADYWLNTSAYEFRVLGTMLGTESADSITGSQFSDAIYGLGGDDTLSGVNGWDNLYGGTGNDRLDGGIGFDFLYGEAGNDVLGGVYGSDDYFGSLSDASGNYYDGGAGSDTYRGTRGNDLFFVGAGSGIDIITQSPQLMDGGYYVSHGGDRIRFADGITPQQLSFSRVGADLRIVISPQDSMTVQGWFGGASTYYRIDNFEFYVNGQPQEVWNASDVTRLALTVRGTEGADALTGTSDEDTLLGLGGSDTLSGLAGADVLDGGTGNDTLLGSTGNDTYVFAQGYGRDVINEQGASDPADRVQFGAGISAADVVRSREGNDLVLTLAGTSDAVVIAGALASPGNRVEQFVFADGSQLPGIDEMVAQLINVVGTAGNDVLAGSTGIDNLYGLDGNDTLSGLDDVDRLEGGAGDDVLTGGAGNDTLLGGAGNDVYMFAAGHGADSISDSEGASRLGFATTSQNLDARVTWSGSSGSLVLSDTVSDSVTIAAGYDNRAALALEFSAGAPQSFDSWLAARQSAGYVLQHVGSAGADTMTGSAGADSMDGSSGADTLFGLSGNDSLRGGSGDDDLNGGAGNDTLDGGAGLDSYRFGRGSGVDTIVNETGTSGESTVRLSAGTGLADVMFQKQGKNNLAFTIDGTGDQLTVQGYVSGKTTLAVGLALSDGETFSSTQLQSQTLRLGTTSADTVRGGSGADRIYGLAGNDTLQGKAGDDWLYGGAGNDRLEGSTGADLYMFSAGWGQDVVSENGTDGAVDRIMFGGGISLAALSFSQSGANLVVTNPDGSKLTVENWYQGSQYQVERFEDADGNALLSTQVQQLAQASSALSAKTFWSSLLPGSLSHDSPTVGLSVDARFTREISGRLVADCP